MNDQINNPNLPSSSPPPPATATPAVETETPNLKLLKLIKISKKVVALSLIGSSFYHIYISINEVFFIFPQISFVGDTQAANDLYIELIKKAIILSFGLITQGFYGVSLLIKTNVNTKIIHIILGIILFIISNVILRLTAINQLSEGLQFLPVT